MEISEIKRKRLALEEQIFKAVNQFNEETGLLVSGIEIDLIDVSTVGEVKGRRYIAGRVTVKIEL